MSTIKEGSDRIKTIVQDLRGFSQLGTLSKKIVDVSECLQSTVNLVKTNFLSVAMFDCEFGTDLKLLCYPAQLNQLFMNLIMNACDAIRQKQQRQLQAKESEIVLGKVVISCHKTVKEMIISIKDDGCGMNEVTKNKLYEPFYTTKDVGEGSGLGLSISYGIAQKHNGKLTEETVLGEGSCFTLTLPFEE